MKIKKKSASLSPRQRREDKQIAFMSGLIGDQAMLDELLANSEPAMRAAMLERISPLLPFVPKEEITADCPNCGLRRGTAISHECVADPAADQQPVSSADSPQAQLPASQ